MLGFLRCVSMYVHRYRYIFDIRSDQSIHPPNNPPTLSTHPQNTTNDPTQQVASGRDLLLQPRSSSSTTTTNSNKTPDPRSSSTTTPSLSLAFPQFLELLVRVADHAFAFAPRVQLPSDNDDEGQEELPLPRNARLLALLPWLHLDNVRARFFAPGGGEAAAAADIFVDLSPAASYGGDGGVAAPAAAGSACSQRRRQQRSLEGEQQAAY